MITIRYNRTTMNIYQVTLVIHIQYLYDDHTTNIQHTSTRSNKSVTYVLDISTEIVRKVLCLFAKSPRSTPGEAQLLCR